MSGGQQKKPHSKSNTKEVQKKCAFPWIVGHNSGAVCELTVLVIKHLAKGLSLSSKEKWVSE